jgi:hypothetical protein
MCGEPSGLAEQGFSLIYTIGRSMMLFSGRLVFGRKQSMTFLPHSGEGQPVSTLLPFCRPCSSCRLPAFLRELLVFPSVGLGPRAPATALRMGRELSGLSFIDRARSSRTRSRTCGKDS